MKIYTSQKSQFGRKLLILNQEVEFDNFGATEVEDQLGKDLIKCNSEWYSDKKFTFKEEIKIAENTSKEFSKKDDEIKQLKEKVALAKSVDEDRKKEIGALKGELEDFKKSLQSVVDEKKLLEEKHQVDVDTWNKEREVFQYTIELMKMNKEELVQTAASLELEEKDYISLKKDELIVVIVKKATEK